MSQHTRTQLHVILHGAVVRLVALFCGLASVVEVANQSGRMWQAAHSALLVLGGWIIATAAVLPLLELRKTEATGLTWSLVVASYSFMTAVILQAVTGVRAISPEGGAITQVAFTANVAAVLSSFLAAALTLMGAANALRTSRQSASIPAMQ